MKTTNLLMLAFAIMLASCSKNAGVTDSNSDQGIDSTITETTVETSESQQLENLLSTPDLTLLELKGNVKEIKKEIKEDGSFVSEKAKFDENGKLTHYSDCDSQGKLSHVKRDSEGKLVSFFGSEWTSVEWDGNRPASLDVQCNELEETYYYTYDKNGRVIKIGHRVQDYNSETDEMIDTTYNYTVTYPKDAFDTNGNWTCRIITSSEGSVTQKRKITYY